MERKCNFCDASVSTQGRFCANCGKAIDGEEIEKLEKEGRKDFLPILLFFFPLIVGLSFLRNYDERIPVVGVLLIDLIFFLLGFILVRIFWFRSGVRVAFRLKSVSLIGIILSILGSVVFACLVHYTVAYFDDSKGSSYVNVFSDFPYPLLWAIGSVAVVPAISEELMFRGVILERLNKMAGPLSAVIASSFLFSIAHLSIFSLIWQIPWAIFIARLRLKYHTLVYGIVIHFCHNTTIVLLEEFGGDISYLFN